MSKLIKCDRCGYVFKPGQAYNEVEIVVELKDVIFTDRVDLCIKCRNKLKDVLNEWWKNVKQQ